MKALKITGGLPVGIAGNGPNVPGVSASTVPSFITGSFTTTTGDTNRWFRYRALPQGEIDMLVVLTVKSFERLFQKNAGLFGS